MIGGPTGTGFRRAFPFTSLGGGSTMVRMMTVGRSLAAACSSSIVSFHRARVFSQKMQAVTDCDEEIKPFEAITNLEQLRGLLRQTEVSLVEMVGVFRVRTVRPKS